jgi:hypothetical protein
MSPNTSIVTRRPYLSTIAPENKPHRNCVRRPRLATRPISASESPTEAMYIEANGRKRR